eukprot:1859142-Prymnesium_polylepis.1
MQGLQDGCSTVTVVVPEGLGPGDAMCVALDGGREHTVIVPDGASEGCMLDVRVPDATVSTGGGPSSLVVCVPTGLAPGDILR